MLGVSEDHGKARKDLNGAELNTIIQMKTAKAVVAFTQWLFGMHVMGIKEPCAGSGALEKEHWGDSQEGMNISSFFEQRKSHGLKY